MNLLALLNKTMVTPARKRILTSTLLISIASVLLVVNRKSILVDLINKKVVKGILIQHHRKCLQQNVYDTLVCGALY